jgi:large subunit ribosomal protein L9
LRAVSARPSSCTARSPRPTSPSFSRLRGFEVDRRKLILPEPIKTLGDHDVPLKLHREVTVALKVRVVKEGGEQSTA